MPRLDGIEACRRAARRPTTADATIVMLTARRRAMPRTRRARPGADLFLTKPFSPLDLLRLVDSMPS